MLRKLWDKRFVRFCTVGLINAVVDFSILNLLVFKAHKSAVIANITSVSIGICISYCLNHIIVFRQGKLKLTGFLKFASVTGLGVLVIQTTVIYLANPLYRDVLKQLVSNTGVQTVASLNLAKASAVGVGMGWNYILYHKIVFARKASEPEAIEAAAGLVL